MKVKAYIYNVSIGSTLGLTVDSLTFDDLVAIYPEGLRQHRSHSEFSIRGIPADDPIVTRSMERLERAGYMPGYRPSGPPNHYGCSLVREYEEEDFEGVTYFELTERDNSELKVGDRDALGRFHFGVSSTRRGVDIGSTGSQYFVPTRVKNLIESSGLVGPLFVETIPTKAFGYGEPTHWSRAGEEWWEFTSTIRMPPVSPRMDSRDDWGVPVNPAEFTGPVQFWGDLYAPVELRYTAESIRAMPPFDLARTHEKRTHIPAGDWTLIASARFRDFCRSHKLKVDWIPVRIDEPVTD